MIHACIAVYSSILFLQYHKFYIYIQEKGTPLYAAAQEGHAAVVKLLIDRNAEVDCICKVSYHANTSTSIKYLDKLSQKRHIVY